MRTATYSTDHSIYYHMDRQPSDEKYPNIQTETTLNRQISEDISNQDDDMPIIEELMHFDSMKVDDPIPCISIPPEDVYII